MTLPPLAYETVDFSTFDLNMKSLPSLAKQPQFVVLTPEDDWFRVASGVEARGCTDAIV